MNYAIIELRKDGTRWRHEMNQQKFDLISQMLEVQRMVYRAKSNYQRAVGALATVIPDFAAGITSTQIELPAATGSEPSVIFVDEIADVSGKTFGPAVMPSPVPLSLSVFQKHYPYYKYAPEQQIELPSSGESK